MWTELRVAVRRLFHDRWSTAAAIGICAFGTGLNTVILTVAYGILVRPLP